MLFFAGIFLAAEAADLYFSAAGKAFDYGLVLALCAAELFCGFVIAAANRRSSSGLTAVSGALLLTLRSGVVAHPAAGICSFLIAGGTAAYLTGNRRKNYFLPFASAFAGMLALLLLFPAFASEAAALSGIFLTGVLVLSATRLGHGRWLFLLLLPLQGFPFAADEKEDPQLEKLTALHCTAASALPSALLPQTEGGKVSILQVTAFPQYAHLIPWRHIPFAEEPFLLDLTLTEPAGKRLKKMDTAFDLISLELLPRWHPRALEQLFKRLYAMTDPGGGVLVFPGELLPFVPPALQAVPVPGGENRRWAVGRSSLDLSVEKLESRLQKYLAAAGETDLMPPGVFTGLYKNALFPTRVDGIAGRGKTSFRGKRGFSPPRT
ncbi:MAG: hypothetical protein IKC65_00650, partial [Lentisphaeria bacterium]|nr:hypothetical protein [Lentisphaeria bacterium]